MEHIILKDNEKEGLVFSISEFMIDLQRLTDSRKARGKRYQLSHILIFILIAKLAGEDTPKGIAEWVKLRRRQLVSSFKTERDSVPAYNTIRRTLADVVKEDELQNLFRLFLYRQYGGQQTVLVVLDGKTVRGTIPKGNTKGVHLLAAYLPEEGVTLFQVAVGAGEKENEITAAPRVLARLNLKGRVVCGDAMFTQRKLSVQIIGQGGDFIWFVKDNQKGLRQDVEQFFVAPRKAQGWHIARLPETVAESCQKAHGRLEQRKLTLVQDETEFVHWPGLQQVFKLERKRISCQTGEITAEVVFGITSLPPERGTAHQLLKWTRSYWGIENGLHYRRDKTLHEDAIRMSDDNQAQVVAVLNNFIVGLASKMGFSNWASARRHFDAQFNLALANVV